MKKTGFLFLLILHTFQVFSQSIFDPTLQPHLDESLRPFYFGIASGDPHANDVIIWTKVIPSSENDQIIEWEVATDTAMQQVVQSGTANATLANAFTAKVLVKNLQPYTTYYYRFKHEGNHSPIGRTKTAAKGKTEKLKLAVVSCADYQMGEYNAYGHLAQRKDIDAIVHLGDYIYEHGARKWGRKRTQKAISRSHVPPHYLQSLRDYRTRYAQYRTDAQLQECHRLHPFITIWDDHEIANNAHAGNASKNWEERKAIAKKAYFEWLPIQDNTEQSIIRSFVFGDLAEMWMLDGRLEGRTPQAKGMNDPDLYAPNRTMLGHDQTDWLLNGMANSNAKWKIMGNQVIFSPLHDSNVFDRRPEIRMDRWDGYPIEQQRIFDFFYKNNLQNILVLTGDVHTSWVFELTAQPLDKNKYNRKTGKGVIGAEFVAPSITSFNLDEVAPRIIAAEGKRRFKRKKHNPHLKYVDLVRHGYFTLTLTPEKAEAEWFYIKRKDIVDLTIEKTVGFGIKHNGNRIYKK